MRALEPGWCGVEFRARDEELARREQAVTERESSCATRETDMQEQERAIASSTDSLRQLQLELARGETAVGSIKVGGSGRPSRVLNSFVLSFSPFEGLGQAETAISAVKAREEAVSAREQSVSQSETEVQAAMEELRERERKVVAAQAATTAAKRNVRWAVAQAVAASCVWGTLGGLCVCALLCPFFCVSRTDSILPASLGTTNLAG